MEDIFKNKLLELKQYGLFALKTGTEVEDMNFDEISFLRNISKDIVPLHVKIGGPEARNDMRFLLSIKVDCIIAPMIESPYALKNFIKTLEEIQHQHKTTCKAGINIETITGYMQLDSILNLEYAKKLYQITAARTDLSGSMDLLPDNPRVIEICKEILLSCKKKNILTSVGGAIQPAIIKNLLEELDSDFINTRHMVIRSDILKNDPEFILRKHLEFEVELYKFLSKTIDPIRKKIHTNRYNVLKERLLKC
ncbi:MAG: aldolase [Leptospiraceae bacterium]|nr:MAG: aldolase [Leptospiraceae bacterium]